MRSKNRSDYGDECNNNSDHVLTSGACGFFNAAFDTHLTRLDSCDGCPLLLDVYSMTCHVARNLANASFQVFHAAFEDVQTPVEHFRVCTRESFA